MPQPISPIIAYNDLRRALVVTDDLPIWALIELQKETARAMSACPEDGPEAQEAEHKVLRAYYDYVDAVLIERQVSAAQGH